MLPGSGSRQQMSICGSEPVWTDALGTTTRPVLSDETLCIIEKICDRRYKNTNFTYSKLYPVIIVTKNKRQADLSSWKEGREEELHHLDVRWVSASPLQGSSHVYLWQWRSIRQADDSLLQTLPHCWTWKSKHLLKQSYILRCKHQIWHVCILGSSFSEIFFATRKYEIWGQRDIEYFWNNWVYGFVSDFVLVLQNIPFV